MAEDLGTWPAEQATVLLEVLQNAGIHAKAKRTRAGVAVTVNDSQADDAHRTLVSNMDAIAQAARSPAPPRSRPRKQTAARGQAFDSARPSKAARQAGSAAGSNRASLLSRPLTIMLIGLAIALLPGVPSAPVLVVTLGIVVYRLGKEPPAGR